MQHDILRVKANYPSKGNNMNFTTAMTQALEKATQLAQKQQSTELFTIHLLTTLSAESSTTFYEMIKRSGVNMDAFHDFLHRRSLLLPRYVVVDTYLPPSSEFIDTLQKSELMASELGDSTLGTEHILLAALKYRGGKELWRVFDLSYDSMKNQLNDTRNDVE